jgi:tRNA 2-selenouridine synthase SelU
MVEQVLFHITLMLQVVVAVELLQLEQTILVNRVVMVEQVQQQVLMQHQQQEQVVVVVVQDFLVQVLVEQVVVELVEDLPVQLQ